MQLFPWLVIQQKKILENDQSPGLILLASTVISLCITNTEFGTAYSNFWITKIGFDNDFFRLKLSLEHWINDGLMTIFFLLIGLEIEREIYVGELQDVKKASLPIVAALGGMFLPAFLHFTLNYQSEGVRGFGIPMATDIAFALGILAILGKKVPVSIKVFLTALAIIDDMGAIIIIAVFYAKSFSLVYFLSAFGLFAGLLLLRRLNEQRLFIYLSVGFAMWYCMLNSGIHPSISGVMLAFTIPFGDGKSSSPSYRLQINIQRPVMFLIIPIFAIANTAILIEGDWIKGLFSLNSIGIFIGLFFGKSLGILLSVLIALYFKIAIMPTGTNWKHFLGAGFLGGIGFTMSIFITLLAFTENDELISSSKIAVLISSFLAGLTGFFILNSLPNQKGLARHVSNV